MPINAKDQSLVTRPIYSARYVIKGMENYHVIKESHVNGRLKTRTFTFVLKILLKRSTKLSHFGLLNWYWYACKYTYSIICCGLYCGQGTVTR